MHRLEDEYRINEEIKAPEVRLVGDNVQNGIYPIKEALRIADELGLDLIEIAPQANPPVCKIQDFSKFIYEKKRKLKEQKAKTVQVTVKEIRLSPNIDDHDFEFKLKHAINFLKEGNKVKVDVFFKGRTILYQDRGEMILLKFADALSEYGKVESLPKLEGKRMIMIIAPRK
ncbi:MAG: translation initiation factor IF-3 [Bacteroidales bacterium]|nr:translation initiation factor IF-3 [Bacteroidales bacterium]